MYTEAMMQQAMQNAVQQAMQQQQQQMQVQVQQLPNGQQIQYVPVPTPMPVQMMPQMMPQMVMPMNFQAPRSPGSRSPAHAVLHGPADRGAAAAAGGGPEGWEFPREPDAQGLAQAPAPEQAAGLPRSEGAERAQDFRWRVEP